MAKIIGGITTSHVPAIGRAIAKGLQQDPTGSPSSTASTPVHPLAAGSSPTWSSCSTTTTA
jgi:protocatechuate 4,5-dioxygenase beta chain